MLIPSKVAKGSKKSKQTTNAGTLKNLNVYDRSDLLNKHLSMPDTEFDEDDKIEAINGQLSLIDFEMQKLQHERHRLLLTRKLE